MIIGVSTLTLLKLPFEERYSSVQKVRVLINSSITGYIFFKPGFTVSVRRRLLRSNPKVYCVPYLAEEQHSSNSSNCNE